MRKNEMREFPSKILLSSLISFCLFAFIFLFFNYAQDKSAYDSKSKRNPFIPLVTADGRLVNLDKEETKADLSIEGIVVDKYGRSYAIVNGSVVAVGDMVGDYRVLKIEDKRVIFIRGGQTRAVKLDKEEEK